jgi:hypothetical protein
MNQTTETRMIAYCGIVCTDCPGYIATQANDLVKLEELAEHARKEYNMPNVTIASVMCDGCLSNSDRKCGYCAECAIRACGVERGVVNCAHCTDYASCEKLNGFLVMVPSARTALEEIRANL